MQTGTRRGMQTMEQSLAELIRKRVITQEAALAVSSRPDQLVGLLERAASRRRSGCGRAERLRLTAPGLRLAGSG